MDRAFVVPLVHPDYGIDAPGVIRNLGLAGIGGIIMAVLVRTQATSIEPLAAVLLWNYGLWGGLACLASAGLMVWSSKSGKLKEREKVLDMIPWRGDELVLDVGCGRGLMLLAAARRLDTGRAYGVDIWQTRDLSGNSPEATMSNAIAERVKDQIELVTGDARSLPFQDNSFDVVLSNLALHNIPDAMGRSQAVQEIARVLKPGGMLAISDFRNTGDYLSTLHELGWQGARRSGFHFLIFPPVRVVTGTKPQ
jgi:SAM-dependent methyltransferase